MINVIFIIFCKAVLVLKYKIIKKGFIKEDIIIFHLKKIDTEILMETKI